MASVSIDIDVEDYLDEVPTSTLAEELRSRIKHGERVEQEILDKLFERDDELEAAAWRFQRGDYEDALFHLESVLGNDFAGLSELLRRRAA